MKYPIAIEPGNEKVAYGAVIPDLPGCYSAGDTLEDAFSNAKEAAELWLETQIEAGGILPKASKLEIVAQILISEGGISALLILTYPNSQTSG
ncbi:MAG: type II toxin-antitoxin system HicB family antitoxin [Burkholderiales bacterium]|nr:type II toxin-antitoxin system HicB family antitoxin [Burkholderiales bacterium]